MLEDVREPFGIMSGLQGCDIMWWWAVADKLTEKVVEILTIEVALLISIVSVAFSIYFGIKNSKRTDVKDIEERVNEKAETKAMLNIINSTTQEIKGRVISMDDQLKDHEKRIVIVEQKSSSAHKRLDTFEHRLDEKEGK